MSIFKNLWSVVADTTEGDDGSLSVQNMPSANKNRMLEVFITVDLNLL
jgi:hypothetical protein